MEVQNLRVYERRGLLPHLEAIAARGDLASFWNRHGDAAPRERQAALGSLLDALAMEFGTATARPEATADALLQRARVATYNSFADAIVREYGARIGRDPDAALLSQSGSWLLARRVGLSPIVGYLTGGVLLGPYTPGFVGDPELAPQLAELGVILLMFGVGLHFHLKDLLAVRDVAVPGALGQSLVATLLGAAVAVGCAFVLRGHGGGRSGSEAAQGALFTEVTKQ